jgi:hypothetical protein
MPELPTVNCQLNRHRSSVIRQHPTANLELSTSKKIDVISPHQTAAYAQAEKLPVEYGK